MRHDRSRAAPAIAGASTEPSSDDLKRWMDLTCQGEAAALESLFRATHRWLVAVAHNYVRSSADAEDVVEEMFLKLWTRRDRLRVTGSVKHYLAVAVRNTALNYLDRRRVETKYMESPNREPWVGGGATTDDVDESPFTPELTQRVQRAIDDLPARARETYCLYYHRNLSYAQIAQAMGVSVRTVEAQLVRSVRKLTQALGGALE